MNEVPDSGVDMRFPRRWLVIPIQSTSDGMAGTY